MTISVTSVSGGWAWWVVFSHDGATFSGKSKSLPEAWQEIWFLKQTNADGL